MSTRRATAASLPKMPRMSRAGASASPASGGAELGGDKLRARTVPLRPTAEPGIFTNSAGLLVDKNGILLSWARAAETQDAAAERILGHKLETPAHLLKWVALDPLMPLATRIDAAKSAAPYYDMRMPLRVEGDLNNRNAGGLDMTKLSAMPRKDREALLKLLKQAGAEV